MTQRTKDNKRILLTDSDFHRRDVNLYWLDITGEQKQQILENEQIVQRLDNIIAGRKDVLETYRKAGYHDSSLMCREVIYDIIDLERIRSGKTD